MTKLEEACDAITDYVLMEALTANVNPAELYVSDDILVTDSYFLLHFATGEEMVTDAEWKYLLDCLNGNRIYSLHEKFKMTGEICLRKRFYSNHSRRDQFDL